MTRFGTAHFVSPLSAVRYYRSNGYPALGDAVKAVDNKIKEKSIFIGEPEIKANQKLELDGDNRYWIEEIEQKRKVSTDITNRFRMFSISFIPGSVRRGSRVKIKDLRRGNTKYIQYAHDGGKANDQAIEYLESIGISVDGLGMAFLDQQCVFLSKNFETQLI